MLPSHGDSFHSTRQAWQTHNNVLEKSELPITSSASATRLRTVLAWFLKTWNGVASSVGAHDRLIVTVRTSANSRQLGCRTSVLMEGWPCRNDRQPACLPYRHCWTWKLIIILASLVVARWCIVARRLAILYCISVFCNRLKAKSLACKCHVHVDTFWDQCHTTPCHVVCQARSCDRTDRQTRRSTPWAAKDPSRSYRYTHALWSTGSASRSKGHRCG